MSSEPKTRTSYEVTIEDRAGDRVAVILKSVITTPTSKRGTEWQQQTRQETTTVLPVSEAHSLQVALAEAFFFATTDGPFVKEQPLVALRWAGDFNILSTHWSHAEARERALEVLATSSGTDHLAIVDADDPAFVRSTVIREG